MYKMWILPRYFAHEVLLEQVIATDKPIIHCDWFLLCGKVKYILLQLRSSLLMHKSFSRCLLTVSPHLYRECTIYLNGDIFINKKFFKMHCETISDFFDYLIFGVDISIVHFSLNDNLYCSTQSCCLPQYC